MKYFISALVISIAASASAQTTFTGNVTGIFSNPVGGLVEGAGTNVIVFPGIDRNGELRFTPASSYAAVDQPFLLGRVDFQSVGTSVTGLTFQVSLGTQNADGFVGSVDFCPPVTLRQGGEPGFREINVLFDPAESRTSAVNGTPYTLAFAGLTESPTYSTDASNTLYTVVNQDPANAYLWATLTQAPAGTPIDPDCGCVDCGCPPPPGVPEPTTCLLAGFGALGLAVMRRFTHASRS